MQNALLHRSEMDVLIINYNNIEHNYFYTYF